MTPTDRRRRLQSDPHTGKELEPVDREKAPEKREIDIEHLSVREGESRNVILLTMKFTDSKGEVELVNFAMPYNKFKNS